MSQLKFTQRRIHQAKPYSLILIFQGATDHSSLKIAVDQDQTVFTLYYSIEVYTVQKTKPLAQVSIVDPSGHFDYPCACIYQLNIEDFVVENHHGDFLIFLFTSKTAKKKANASFHCTTVQCVVVRRT